jgi:hypothetical protein
MTRINNKYGKLQQCNNRVWKQRNVAPLLLCCVVAIGAFYSHPKKQLQFTTYLINQKLPTCSSTSLIFDKKMDASDGLCNQPI